MEKHSMPERFITLQDAVERFGLENKKAIIQYALQVGNSKPDIQLFFTSITDNKILECNNDEVLELFNGSASFIHDDPVREQRIRESYKIYEHNGFPAYESEEHRSERIQKEIKDLRNKNTVQLEDIFIEASQIKALLKNKFSYTKPELTFKNQQLNDTETILKIKKTNYLFAKKENEKIWNIEFEDECGSYPEIKGFLYIAFLLANPDKEYSPHNLYLNVEGVELSTISSHTHEMSPEELAKENLYSTDMSCQEDHLKQIKKNNAAIKSFISDLKEKVEEAKIKGDIEEEEELNDQIKQYTKLANSEININGQSRLNGSMHEKQRIRIFRLISRAKDKLKNNMPKLTNHLTKYLKHANVAIYTPPEDTKKWITKK